MLASHEGDPGSIPGRIIPDFCMWESCRTMPLVGGFSRGSPASPSLAFRRCSILTSITLTGYQDLDVKNVQIFSLTHFDYHHTFRKMCLFVKIFSSTPATAPNPRASVFHLFRTARVERGDWPEHLARMPLKYFPSPELSRCGPLLEQGPQGTEASATRPPCKNITFSPQNALESAVWARGSLKKFKADPKLFDSRAEKSTRQEGELKAPSHSEAQQTRRDPMSEVSTGANRVSGLSLLRLKGREVVQRKLALRRRGFKVAAWLKEFCMSETCRPPTTATWALSPPPPPPLSAHVGNVADIASNQRVSQRTSLSPTLELHRYCLSGASLQLFAIVDVGVSQSQCEITSQKLRHVDAVRMRSTTAVPETEAVSLTSVSVFTYYYCDIFTRKHVNTDNVSFLFRLGAAVVERVFCSRSIKANRFQSPARSLRIFASGNRAGRCRSSASFLGGLLPHFTLTGSQDLVA
ncbi:hypothetical protein PR048_021807 [Dryococelus australis]|uniref:Uncharacterized protein n=1 Tax=Dryococelus australis TaxID=614101 RepID=A0ABQ9GZ90_9NEOP|nr:hypothetical protein PR048_021807 [Dryococelus australis]